MYRSTAVHLPHLFLLFLLFILFVFVFLIDVISHQVVFVCFIFLVTVHHLCHRVICELLLHLFSCLVIVPPASQTGQLSTIIIGISTTFY